MLVSSDYPYLQVRVTVRTRSFVYRALLDTGFDGYLVLPENLESQLGAPEFQVKTRLADGSERIYLPGEPMYQRLMIGGAG